MSSLSETQPMKCLACGVEKDPEVFEVYPYAAEDNICNEPIPPFSELECEPSIKQSNQWKRVKVCHECYHKLQPDMWISQRCWEALNPITPFDQLPNM